MVFHALFKRQRSWKGSLPQAAWKCPTLKHSTWLLCPKMQDRVKHLARHTTKGKANCCIPGTLAKRRSNLPDLFLLRIPWKQPRDLRLGSSLAKGLKREKTWPNVASSLPKIVPLAFSRYGPALGIHIIHKKHTHIAHWIITVLIEKYIHSFKC